MAVSDLEYSVDKEIAYFFTKTSATRAACDAYVVEHLGGDIVPVAVQGVCSYTVYARPSGEYVAQFRLRSLELKMETIGDDIKGREPVYVYIMDRIRGISYLDFILTYNGRIPENSATFFALSWKAPRAVDQAYRDGLFHKYKKELGLLLTSLPLRFRPDFGVCNVMVDETSCNLAGVIGWAEAEIAPFGLILHSHQRLIAKVHLRAGWIRYDDYVTLEEIFWATLRKEAGGLGDETIRLVKLARITGLLLSRGFTSRLADQPDPVPIHDDERGAYNMRDLDGLLIHPDTIITELT
ncbi:hypothetical protein BJY00DRAFT_297708 [Aspergillus carlsbadensis]|nr:hypothetical protein BJY00DRAFT_297708 [Aspergillus carlsbadensis]